MSKRIKKNSLKINVIKNAGIPKSFRASWAMTSNSHLKEFKVQWHWYRYRKKGTNTKLVLVKEEEETIQATNSQVLNFESTKEYTDEYSILKVRVRPYSTTHKVNKKDTNYWTGEWSGWVKYNITKKQGPLPPSNVSYQFKNLNKKMVISATRSSSGGVNDAKKICFKLHNVTDSTYSYHPSKTSGYSVNATTGVASFVFEPELGKSYRISAASIDSNGTFSAFTPETPSPTEDPRVIYALPKAPASITMIRVDEIKRESNQVQLSLDWNYPGGHITNYELEWTYDTRYFDVGGPVESAQFDATTGRTFSINIGDYLGKTWYFRVRSVNERGHSAWCEVKSIIIGLSPSAPTTWSLKNSVKNDEDIHLFWTHNSKDGSEESAAQVELTVHYSHGLSPYDPEGVDGFESDNDYTSIITVPKNKINTAIGEEEKTSEYKILANTYNDDVEINWRVRTAGVKTAYPELPVHNENSKMFDEYLNGILQSYAQASVRRLLRYGNKSYAPNPFESPLRYYTGKPYPNGHISIDCSSFVIMSLMGVSYDDSPYVTHRPFKINKHIPFAYDFKSKRVKYAANLCRFMDERKRKISSTDSSGHFSIGRANKGDLIFFHTRTPESWASYYRAYHHVNHVAIITDVKISGENVTDVLYMEATATPGSSNDLKGWNPVKSHWLTEKYKTQAELDKAVEGIYRPVLSKNVSDIYDNDLDFGEWSPLRVINSYSSPNCYMNPNTSYEETNSNLLYLQDFTEPTNTITVKDELVTVTSNSDSIKEFTMSSFNDEDMFDETATYTMSIQQISSVQTNNVNGVFTLRQGMTPIARVAFGDKYSEPDPEIPYLVTTFNVTKQPIGTQDMLLFSIDDEVLTGNSVTFRIKIEKSSTATPWIPYGFDMTNQIYQYPFRISATVTPETQRAIRYSLVVTSVNDYHTVGDDGKDIFYPPGSEIFNEIFISDKNSPNLFSKVFTPGDLYLQPNKSYEFALTAYMDSGLTASDTQEYYVTLPDDEFELDVEPSFDEENLVMYLTPYAYKDDNTDVHLDDVILSVYRREFDGTMTLLQDNLDGSLNVTITDPHPALDFARYRVVGYRNSSGRMIYSDIPSIETHIPTLIIQWDAKWSSYSYDPDEIVDDDAPRQSMLRLPYNLDTSEQNDLDVSLIEYAGRKHPVSHYGTQTGERSSFSCDVPAYDKETIYQLRRLARYPGSVYIREPNGSGYWATVKVSFNIEHTALVVPVSIEATRVEGGI